MQSYTTTTAGGAVATEETDRLISSDKVVGTAVYNLQGEHLGSVYNLTVDKISGQVAYAVMSFGGFLGIGESYVRAAMSSILTVGGSRKPRAIPRAISPTGLIAPMVTGSMTITGCRLTVFELGDASRHAATASGSQG
jgi:sporulation protein YlmC with PRC-barrel domain